MKFQLLTTILFFTVCASSAQWTTSGTDITTTNNVGIGTEDPEETLDVNGVVKSKALKLTSANETGSVNGFYNKIQLEGTLHSAIVHSSGTLNELMFGFHDNGYFYWGTGRSATNPDYYSMTLNGNTGDLVAKGELQSSSLNIENGDGSLSTTIVPNIISFNRDGIGYIDSKSETGSLAIRTGGVDNIDVFIKNDGNVGIGTTEPQALLNLVNNSTIGLSDLSQASLLIGSAEIGIGLDTNELVMKGADVNIGTISEHDVRFISNKVTRMTLNGETGYVGIGTTNPQNKLSVQGTIWATKVKVSLTDGADWVFEDDYNLRSLAEVEKFIKINKHLPEVPSAEEFRRNDMEVSKMTNTLLQKIEELTLYTIEQEKKIEDFENYKKLQDQKMEALVVRLQALEQN